MKNIIKAISVLASLALLTGCGAPNNSEQAADYNVPNTNAADTLKESSEVPDSSWDPVHIHQVRTEAEDYMHYPGRKD